MSVFVRILLPLLLFLPLASCGSTSPLPEGEVPLDFLFTYDREDVAAPTGEGTFPGAPGAAGKWPPSFRAEVDGTGNVDCTVHYGPAKDKVRNTSLKLADEEFLAVYDALREADFYTLKDRYGDPESMPKRSFGLISRNQAKEVVVNGPGVAVLAEVERVLLRFLPVEELQKVPLVESKVVVMDLRNGVFHPGSSAEVRKIPEDQRRVYPHPWAALDDGGKPSPEFPPMETWDRK